MRNIKKMALSVLILALSVSLLSSCGNKTKSIKGQWYNENGKCLDIRSDGTWDLEDNYGTGKWKVLDDKVTIEFTDFYGDTQKSEIFENDLGQYIDFGYYGDFYKDSYPTKEEFSKYKKNNSISVNPFEKLKFEISGISPYCEITLNTGECDGTVQQYVEFQLDKQYYANGNTAVITATISEETGDENYCLSSSTKEIPITGQPEYIYSMDGVDTTELKKELSDFVNGNISGALKEAEESFWGEGTVLGNLVKLYQGDVNECSYSDVYLSTLKQTKELSYEDNYINKLTVVYSGKYTNIDGGGNFYSCVSACNIIKYPDGKIKWGNESNDAKDFLVEKASESVENSITTIIMSKSSNYNISKVEF